MKTFAASLFAAALAVLLTPPFLLPTEGQFVIDPYRFASGVPALPTTNLVVNLAADGDVYNTGTTQCLDGESVATWVDAAGTAQNATQATAADKPTWFAGGGVPYVEFDGTEYLRGSATILSGNAATIYVVAATDTITSVQIAAGVYDESSSNDFHAIGVTTNPANGTVHSPMSGDGTVYTPRSSTQISASTPYVLHASGNLTNRDVWIENAGNGNDTNTSTFDYTQCDLYTVGARYYALTEGSNFDGKIYHVLIYDEVHDSSERADTVAYLIDKWGL